MTPKPTAPPAPTSIELEYCGPDLATSAVFGVLRVGQRYAADVAFATYLLAHHPEHWRRPTE